MTNSLPSPPAAAALLIKRRSTRQNLTSFSRACGFEPAHHHRYLIAHLEKVASGEIRRLAVFMPPGSAKSTYCSVLFPPWFLSRHPQSNILAASHTVELAQRFGRKVRNLVADPYMAELLNLKLESDNSAAGRWATTSGGEYYAAGAGVGVAGFRGDFVIIDDPIRSRDDADSDLVRQRVWDWYQGDVRPRLRPGARIILVQTRWHEDDLAGRILADMGAGGEEWTVVSLPAEALEGDPLGRAPGQMLWDDDGYGYARFLRAEKEQQTARNWSALYQQQPTPDSGNFFDADWLRAYITAPPIETLSIYGASDYAVTADGGDYTVHVVLGLDPDDRLYLLDLWRGQTASDVWVDQWCALVRKWKPLGWAEETGQITGGVGPFRDAEASRQKAYCAIELIPVGQRNKATRAQSIRGRMGHAAGGLWCPVKAPWYADLRAELLSFPAGKHDDMVDALSLAGQLLDMMVPGRRPKVETNKTVISGYKPVRDIDDDRDAWKTY
jgi:predicted phage terminase large subunit-like protein